MTPELILRYAKREQPRIIDLIRAMVECESPSDDPRALANCASLLCDIAAPFSTIRADRHGNLEFDFKLPGRKPGGRILGIGHYDTVWPTGTLQSMPFQQKKGRLWGPGVLDMKGGLAFFFFAVRLLRDLEIPVKRAVTLQVNVDEETGSRTSRALTERNAKRSAAVLVLEPGTGLTGKLKTARKGIAGYRVDVIGVAAHSGVDFEAGASAIVELARQIERITKLTDLQRGITVNPGVIGGGTRSNVTAAHAWCAVDVRAPRLSDAKSVDRAMRGLKAIDRRCSVTVDGGLNRPPMERSKGVAGLYATAKRLGQSIGVTVEESATGGGSDGNFTAALGVPTLDGLGAVGEGAHAAQESLLVNRIADRTALLALLLAEL